MRISDWSSDVCSSDLALALPQAAILARVTRSSVLETLGEDYVRTARAKGLTRRAALWRHAVRNALIPVVTIMGLQFSFLQIGRASRRARVCQYVYISVHPVSIY